MEVIPLIVLYSESPISRAYMAIFKSMNLMPKYLIKLVPVKDKQAKKTIAPWLPNKIRKVYLDLLYSARAMYWYNYIKKNYSSLYNQMISKILTHYKLDNNLFDYMEISFKEYAAENKETIFINDLKDIVILNKLKELSPCNILYTGGGIVPESLLNLDGVKFVHFHPGVLPDIRGADGLLWSAMLNNKVGCTCFYMDKGIDTGDIIYTDESDLLTFSIEKRNIDSKMLYRSIFSFYDPILRANLLKKYLLNYMNYEKLAKKQDLSKGNTYRFLHPKMREFVLNNIFIESF